ncbi:hypothetical protein BX666DRAFT_1421226 [Dichotomocladium elegans]|nr:hypothetical protein BX666DRAFT_1421226 [Dichotomocladium elegans]
MVDMAYDVICLGIREGWGGEKINRKKKSGSRSNLPFFFILKSLLLLLKTSAMQDTDEDLSKRLNSIAFSTPEELLTKKLDSAHIAPKSSTGMFGSDNNASRITHSRSSPATVTQQQRDDSTWDSLPTESSDGNDDEGWGALPSINTAAAGDSLFGFSSILQTDYYAPSSASVKPNSAFAKFHDTPVSFTSAPSNIPP